MRNLAAVFAAATLMLPYSSASAVNAPTLAGVWDGTIGNLPVRACFNDADAAGGFGAYYYKSHLQLIFIRQLEGKSTNYVEGYPWDKKVPQWTFGQVTAHEITARWSNGKRELPILLEHLAGPSSTEEETPCSSKLFHQERLGGIKVVSRPAVKNGLHYSRLVLEYPDHQEVGVETFRLVGSSLAIRRINALLRKPFSGHPPEWHDCELTAAANGSNGGWSESYEPVALTGHWLRATQHVEAYCGGPHPDSWTTPHMYDLQTGREIDLSKWLNKLVGRPAFERLLFASWARGDDPDCHEVVEHSIKSFSLDIELRRDGLAFTPNDLPHVAAACGDEFLVPFRKLGPYLTKEGRKNVAALQAEFAAKR